MKLNHICLGCMEEKGQVSTCPYCGYREGTPASAPHYLPPGTILAGKYLIGRGLGHGGFGTTYLAHDLVLGIKLAIKEYLPQDCASRQPGQTEVTPFTGEGEKRFRQGLESFLQEARTLARFDGQPGIVGVRDFFTENGTAYLVMNYLEGITLKDVLVKSGGQPMPYDRLIKIMLPIMGALERVHAAGLLHRDVSPDNIFLTTQGQVVLIDFGAARQSMSVQRSMSVILKPGYAPEEQYRSRGNQGPWTDVYALGACMYRALTGKIPPEALERIPNDTLVPPSRLGVGIPQRAEQALLRAMAVKAEERFQSVEAFRHALTNAPMAGQGPNQHAPKTRQNTQAAGAAQRSAKRPVDPVTYPLKAKKKKGSAGVSILIAILLIALVFGLGVAVFSMIQAALDRTSIPGVTTPTPSPGMVTPPPSESPGAPLDETATPTIEPSPSEEPTPTPTPAYEGPEEFRPGAVPSRSISSFVPTGYKLVREERGEAFSYWLTGKKPVSMPSLLAARFIYDQEENHPDGQSFYYLLDGDGNLVYGPGESNNYSILLPVDCAVGVSYSGVYGQCEVVAVNYSTSVNDYNISNAVVVSCDQGYVFFVPDIGVACIKSELEGGAVSMMITTREAVDSSLFHQFIEE